MKRPARGSVIKRNDVKIIENGIIYRNEPERIYILAVMHLRREPGYWKDRH